MVLRRLGNKQKVAKEIIQYFPKHDIYFEPFFGAGGMFFSKTKARYNYVNDFDEDVYNLFMVLSQSKDELLELAELMPIHNRLWQHWRKNRESDPIRKALRFLMLSNFGYMGQPKTLVFRPDNSKKILLNKIKLTHERIKDVRFNNCDFRDFFKRYSISDNQEKAFIYCDPPYLDTDNNYSSGFTKEDSNDLFDVLQETGIKWAMSEFDHPFILKQAKERGLNVIHVGERKNIKNRRTEILVINYENRQLSLFGQTEN